jgi:hypothetical protein
MATRAIVTDQPEVGCEMCGRRLLKGERPEGFLAHGDTRSVCELCVPRAVSAGWVRAAGSAPTRPAPGTRRQRKPLLGRVRRRREEADQPTDGGAFKQQADEVPLGAASSPFLDQETAELDEVPRPAGERHDPAVQAAIDAFNDSDQPRRIAGVSRSFGTPLVTVRRVGASSQGMDDAALGPSAGERMTVVAAWELCWYRWDIDLDGYGSAAELVDRGTELEELAAEDLEANVAVDERGRLVIASTGAATSATI